MEDLETNDESCLFLSRYRLVRATCAFEVSARHSTDKWRKGDKLRVERVMDRDKSTILFLVGEEWFPHSLFDYTIPSDLVITGLRK